MLSGKFRISYNNNEINNETLQSIICENVQYCKDFIVTFEFKDASILYSSAQNSVGGVDRFFTFKARNNKDFERLRSFVSSKQFADIVLGNYGNKGTITFDCD